MRQTAMIKRREAIFAISLAAMGTVTALGCHLMQRFEQDQTAALVESNTVVVPQGETATLTSSEEDAEIFIPVPWEGTVKIRLEKSEWFESFAKAAQAYNIGQRTTDRVDDNAPYLICVIAMDNIDAVMTSYAVDSQKNLLSTAAFDATAFTLNNDRGGCYPTSLSVNADMYPNTLAFPLDTGESATLVLGFPLDRGIAATDKLSLHLVTSMVQFQVEPTAWK